MPHEQKKAHIIVIGNEKGGSGKSTTAMHIIVSLLKKNFKVAVVDLDSRQKTLARYLENREKYAEQHALTLSMPTVHVLSRSTEGTHESMMLQDNNNFKKLINFLNVDADYIVLDCPGSYTNL